MPIDVRQGPKVKDVFPYRDNVIVIPVEAPKMIGKIHLPEDSRRKQIYGRIWKVGNEVPSNYKEGDMVVFAQYAGVEITLDNLDGVDDELQALIMSYKQILAKVDIGVEAQTGESKVGGSGLDNQDMFQV